MKKLSLKTKLLNTSRLIFKNRFAESILIPLTKGKKWDQRIARIPANYYQYPKPSWRNVERNGFQFQLDISDYMQWLLYFGILAEPRETLYKLIKPGMLIIDVGANIGETSMEFSRLTGEKGKVIALEPDPETFVRLQKHLSLNNCVNVMAINKGLGKEDAKLIMEMGEHNSGGNRISPEQNKVGKQIQITSLDHMVENLNIAKVDFIKIDVEGYEYHVLLGAEKTIAHSRPTLFIELVDDFLRAQEASSEMLTTFLSTRNYSLKNANDGSTIHPTTNFSDTHFDIIALPQ